MIILNDKKFWKHQCIHCHDPIWRPKPQGRFYCGTCEQKMKEPREKVFITLPCSICGEPIPKRSYEFKKVTCIMCKKDRMSGYNKIYNQRHKSTVGVFIRQFTIKSIHS